MCHLSYIDFLLHQKSSSGVLEPITFRVSSSSECPGNVPGVSLCRLWHSYNGLFKQSLVQWIVQAVTGIRGKSMYIGSSI